MKGSNGIELRPGEQILGLVRQSIFARPVLLLAIVAWVLFPYFFFFPLFLYGPFGIGVFIIAVLSGVGFAYRQWFLWKNSLLLITDRRVIDVDQTGFFRRDVSEVFYADILETRVVSRGIWQRIFGIATVHVRTVKTFAYDLELTGMKNAVNVARLIDEVQCIVTPRPGAETFHVKEIPHEA